MKQCGRNGITAFLLGFVVLFVGCRLTEGTMTTQNEAMVVKEINTLLTDYAKAVAIWDREAINHFWGDSDDFVLAGDGVILGGHNEWTKTLDQYEQEVESWLYFEYRNTHVEALSTDAATATTEFEHSRITTKGDTVTVRGASTYVFRRIVGKWNVVHTNGTHIES